MQQGWQRLPLHSPVPPPLTEPYCSERAAGMFGVGPFALAQLLVEIPWLLGQAVVYAASELVGAALAPDREVQSLGQGRGADALPAGVMISHSVVTCCLQSCTGWFGSSGTPERCASCGCSRSEISRHRRRHRGS